MKTIKVSLIKDKTFKLGRRSWRNVHIFEDVETGEMPLSAESSLVKKTSIIKKNPELIKECQSYCLPPIFEYALGQTHTIKGISSGRRALYLPKTYKLNLKSLGSSEEDINQEFVVDVKGSGIRLENSEHVSEEKVKEFIRKHRIKRFKNKDLSNELIFSRNEYMYFNTPEGAQDVEGGDGSIEAFEYFSKLGFKLAPVVCRITYPLSVQKLAKELDTERALKLKLAQEKRLMPSFVRGAYFENNPGRNKELINLISKDKEVINKLPNIMLEDMTTYFDNLAWTTEKRGSKYYWDCLTNLESVFEEPNNMFDKNYGWYISKDLVLAGTGIYFVDLEGALIDYDAKDRAQLRHQHGLYLTTLLKDFFRLQANYNIAKENKEDSPKKRKIELDSRDALLQRLNQSDYISAVNNKNSVDVTINYESIKKEEYKISKTKLPMVTEGFS